MTEEYNIFVFGRSIGSGKKLLIHKIKYAYYLIIV